MRVLYLIMISALASLSAQSEQSYLTTTVNFQTYFTITNELIRTSQNYSPSDYYYTEETLLADINKYQHVRVLSETGTDESSFSVLSGGSYVDTHDDLYRLYIFRDDNGETWNSVTFNGYSGTYLGPGKLYVGWRYRVNSRITSSSYYGIATEPIIESTVTVNRRYRVLIEGKDEDESEPKFSIALDNDGDRVAMGYKEDGSNAVIRVYEFDGSSWNQLGDDVE